MTIQQELHCPKCGGDKIIYAGTSTLGIGGYRSTDARYTCKDCSYTGPLVIDMRRKKMEGKNSEGEKKTLKLPILWVIILAIISLLGITFGQKIELAVSFFLVFSVILMIFFYFFAKEDEFIPVEKDLNSLDEEGILKE